MMQSHAPMPAGQTEQVQKFIEQTLLLLKQSTSTDSATQRDVQAKQYDWKLLPEYNYALLLIFSDDKIADDIIRTLAGISLKNNVRSNYHNFTPEFKNLLKQQGLALLRDPVKSIRSTAAVLIVTIASSGEIKTWQELLPTLTQLIVSPDNQTAESAFYALEKICEDLSHVMCNPEMASNLDYFVPGLIRLFQHQNPKMRNHALVCINCFVTLQAPAIMNSINEYVEGLFQLARDPNTEVKKNVCRSLVALYETCPEALEPYLKNVIEFMMISSEHEDKDIALEACEFWLSISDNDYGMKVLAQYLPKLIPFLLEQMRYSDEDLESMQGDLEEDYMIPDKQDDIKPLFHKPKGHIGNEAGDEESEYSDDDEDFDDDGPSAPWNIRKCTAASLDCIAHRFGNDILTIVLPELNKTIGSDNWKVKEGAILALGAIAEGCLDGLAQFLPQSIPFLVSSLKDSHPLVRVITCWTLSRYTSWIMSNPNQNGFEKVLRGLLCCILDNNKRVQEAACSAFSTLAESANNELVPYISDVLNVLIQAFDKYQQINQVHLYDAVGTLANAVKQHINQPQYIEILMPPIIKKWNSFKDDDQDLFPLLECLSFIALALGNGFAPYSEGVFKRCLSLVDQCLQQDIAFSLDPVNREMPNKDFMIAALDLLSGLAEALSDSICTLAASSNIVELTIRCMLDTMAEVRQSSFALLGDLTKACFHLIKPNLPKVIEALTENLSYDQIPCCNNATWAVGELAIQLGSEMRPYAHLFINQLIKNINQPQIPRTLLDNTAVSLGRLSLVCPDELAPHLKEFITPWCSSVKTIRDNSAKDSAFRGICELIKKDSTGIVGDFLNFCEAIACWDEPQPDLKRLFYDLLHSYKSHIGNEAWERFKLDFKPEYRDKLSLHYQV